MSEHQEMEPTDGELLARYRRGDAPALGRLIEKYRRPLFGYIINMTEGREDVDELFQEVWFRVIRKIGLYQERNFFGWLVRIAHNLVIDRARRSKPDFSLDAESEETGATLADRIADGGLDPSQDVTDQDLGRKIGLAVNSLPREQKEVFVMRAYSGLSFKQIASVQKVSINTALARMQYAVAKLRPLLEKDYHAL
jgi:RNA polymerase sigma-70 factor (ECF subfamily)